MLEELLVKKCKRYNKNAQRIVFERYSGHLRYICLQYIKDANYAEDILQESFIKIFSSMDSFSWKGNGSLFSWMKRIVINHAISYLRKNNRISYLGDEEIGYYEDENIEEHEKEIEWNEVDKDKVDFSIIQKADFSVSELEKALETVKEAFRVVFKMHVIDGLKHQEIAESLGIDEKTSRSRLLRARKALQLTLYNMSLNKLQPVKLND